jgi:hypothetical protein
MDFDKFTNELKATYPCLQNVIRMKNKEQMNIKLVKLEFSKPDERDKILDRGKIFVNSLSFDVVEYLAPARVLICNKCMGIGHFRKQCTQRDDICKKCGGIYLNINDHVTSCSQLRCINCHGNHMANDTRCPKVKQFRADLTKYLLSPAIPANFVGVNIDPMSNDFPQMNPAQRPTLFNYSGINKFNNLTANNNINNLVMSKLDEINDKLEKLSNKTDKVENGLEGIRKTMDELNVKVIDLTMDNAVIKEKLNNHERIMKDVVVPVMKLLINFTKELNYDRGRWKNADFGSQIEVYTKQLNNINEFKDLL